MKNILKMDYWKKRIGLLKYQRRILWINNKTYYDDIEFITALIKQHNELLNKKYVNRYIKYWENENSSCDALEYVNQWLS